jgi:hypothetical protein
MEKRLLKELDGWRRFFQQHKSSPEYREGVLDAFGDIAVFYNYPALDAQVELLRREFLP